MMILQGTARRSSQVAIHRFSTCDGAITEAYHRQVDAGDIQRDEQQLKLASKLDSLHAQLRSYKSHSDDEIRLVIEPISPSKVIRKWLLQIRSPSPRGVYIHGSVGVGKSFLMDLFFSNVTNIPSHKRRAHFHEFMLNVHERIHRFKLKCPKGDPIPQVAVALAKEARLLCFDEFQVTDIADAMVMKRLFELLFDMGVVVVCTSNRSPDQLFEGGLNRSLILPFIETLKLKCDIVSMEATHDYRRDVSTPKTPYSYFWSSNRGGCTVLLKNVFQKHGEAKSETVEVMMGRKVQIARANSRCAWFHFSDLCHQPLGAADYIALSVRFPIIIVDHVPQLGSDMYNEARRFLTLIDALYESNTRLVIGSDVPLNDLFVEFDATLASQDGDEELGGAVFVKGEGGTSSSHATTMVRSKNGAVVEWSATGRVGVSLAQLSAVKDVVFSFRRAESRLAEMMRSEWGR